jgi:hypothetical protein
VACGEILIGLALCKRDEFESTLTVLYANNFEIQNYNKKGGVANAKM